ncbi:MAG: ATP-binding protein, partial [Desulfatirhabdiaceae bacterium]|nr:ATP-binding protein [Desulfatirhabdiaceae bacterium]
GLRAKDLEKQILTFARQAGEELKPVQVSILVKEALKLLRSSLPTTIEIKQNIESDSLIMADPTQVHQVVMNLCTNAGQAMEEEGGVLHVGLTDVRLDADFTKTCEDLIPGDYLKLSVSDTGSGISPEVMKSIFDPYFTTKAPGEGTGMGLATVHGIVKHNGGEIVVDSEVENGSIFTVYLPITKKRTGAESYHAEALPFGTERILFVDDEPPIAAMGGKLLEGLGYQVTARTSSVEALALFRSKPDDFDLIISDMTMPNMTGDKLAVELMKIRPGIPVILCTGYSKKISNEAALDIGIKAFAYKPTVKADLARTIRKVLDEAKGSA